ncbi:mechanosensitive ion channel family protein [Sulfurimonas sp. SAG-AH-194-C20]|nr:mechanosensitive ion channel family protein [Sulfurimonas sp. SAG-AH-194-C20]MDF1878331.1 mechanosensitive ion channel family protein [Sulfurimonas sp. SAG-AH-194-C20]
MSEELEQANQVYNTIINYITNYSFQLIGALLIVIIGVIASKHIHKFILKVLLKNKIDETLSGFVANFVRFIVVTMMLIVALGKLGISIAPFIAAVGALSLTAGLALQGSVSNFAAGIVLVITKPFKIGDTITVHDVYGEVTEIKLSYSVLVNEDKEQITIPNKYMIGDVLVNSFSYRVVEGSVGVSYDSDIKKVIQIIEDVLGDFSVLNAENEPIIGVEKFNESSIDIAYRYWAPTHAYFKTQYSVNLAVITAFNREKITIPFPQREIKILGDRNAN